MIMREIMIKLVLLKTKRKMTIRIMGLVLLYKLLIMIKQIKPMSTVKLVKIIMELTLQLCMIIGKEMRMIINPTVRATTKKVWKMRVLMLPIKKE